jgi:hypothetical protein
VTARPMTLMAKDRAIAEVEEIFASLEVIHFAHRTPGINFVPRRGRASRACLPRAASLMRHVFVWRCSDSDGAVRYRGRSGAVDC